VLTLDGSEGEGGGQVLRSALTLAALTGTPFRLVNVRARRPRPGLAAQHLAALHAAAAVCDAEVEGAALGSLEVRFAPRAPRAGDYAFDVGTAGAVSLVLQTVLPVLAWAGGVSRVRVRGGTHVRWSPCFEHLDWQWRWAVARAGYAFSLELVRAGFYPEGGGEVAAQVEPVSRPRPVRLVARGAPEVLEGRSAVGRLPDHVARRQREAALAALRGVWRGPVAVETARLDSAGPGSVIALRARFAGGAGCCCALGERGLPAERVGETAARCLREWLAGEGAVDPWLADQLLVPLAFVPGESELTTTRVTRHLLTNAAVVRRFLGGDAVTVVGGEGAPGRVTVRGSCPAGAGAAQ